MVILTKKIKQEEINDNLRLADESLAKHVNATSYEEGMQYLNDVNAFLTKASNLQCKGR